MVKLYRPDGSFRGMFGGFGDAPGALAYPVSLATDGKATLYVLERTTGRLQAFAWESLIALKAS